MRLFPVAVLLCVIIFLSACGTVDPAKKYPHMVADADPVSAGSIEAQFDQLFSSQPKKAAIDVIFYPRLNAVALEFRYELINHRQFWDEAGRGQFVEALERYKADYAEKNLVDKYRTTRAVYGKVQGRVEWETIKKFGKTYVAYPTIEMGYRFKAKFPFFATLMRSAKPESDAGDDSGRGDSQQITMYFTRSQAEELVALFNQDYLMGLLQTVAEEPQAEAEEPAAEKVPYQEWGQN